MTWLLENPLPSILIGCLTVAILGGGWLQTGQKWLLYVALLCVALTITAVVVEQLVVTDREQVTARLYEIAAAVESNEIPKTLSYASKNVPRVRQQAAAELPQYEFHEVKIRNLEIEVVPESRPLRAELSFNVVVILSTRNGLLRESRIPRYVEATMLEEEDGQWRVSAYQHYEPFRGFRKESNQRNFDPSRQ